MVPDGERHHLLPAHHGGAVGELEGVGDDGLALVVLGVGEGLGDGGVAEGVGDGDGGMLTLAAGAPTTSVTVDP